MPSPALNLQHIATILYSEAHEPAHLPTCDHYAGNPRFFEKALQIRDQLGDCFDITLDLEDGAVVSDQSSQHARWVIDALTTFEARYGQAARKPGVRLHPTHHEAFIHEIEVLLTPGQPMPSYLMLPKVLDAQDAHNAVETLNAHGQKHGVSIPPIHMLIETHGALAEVQAIAALPQVESLSFGIMDFVSSHRGAIPKTTLNSPDQFKHPLIQSAKIAISAACHRYGKVPSHNVCRQIQDPSQAHKDAQQAKTQFGFTRMWSIHPAQVQQIVQAMQPNTEEIQEAQLILSQAQAAEWGPIQFNSELHDRASYRYFFEILKRASHFQTH